MSDTTLYWHDYETWGANPSLDKPVQFAGIRTDEALNIIGEHLVCYCKPTPDCLPNPKACIVTGITPQEALAKGEAEPVFFQHIMDEFSLPGTCGVGYNTIRFDDEVTRYGLYRNFWDPYEREWKNGNSRWDIIDMVRLVYALKPETLTWPMREGNVGPSFRLEELSAANGIEHSSAHDALSDVYATIELAKLIRGRHPKLYDYTFQLRNKKRVAELIDIPNKKPLLHISSRFPATQGCAALVVPLMKHPSNNNSVIAYDLSVDPTPLIELSVDEVARRVFSRQDELAEGENRIPLKEIHLNKSPVILTTKLLDKNVEQRLGINKGQCEQYWQQLCQVSLEDKLTDIYQQKIFTASDDVERQLYDGFITDHDRLLLPKIRQAAPEKLVEFSTLLEDQRLKRLLLRYRARHYPETLSGEENERWQDWCYRRLTEPEAGASITLEAYFDELDELAGDEGVSPTVIDALQQYGDQVLG